MISETIETSFSSVPTQVFDTNIMIIKCKSCSNNFLSYSTSTRYCEKCDVLNTDPIEGEFISCIVIKTNTSTETDTDTPNTPTGDTTNSSMSGDEQYYKNCQVVITYKIVDGKGEEFYESETLPLIKTITDSDIRVVKGVKYIYPSNKNLQEYYKVQKINSCKDEYTIVSAIVVNFDKVVLI